MTIKRVNPIARVMLQNRRRTQAVSNKKKYNRKKDKQKNEKPVR